MCLFGVCSCKLFTNVSSSLEEYICALFLEECIWKSKVIHLDVSKLYKRKIMIFILFHLQLEYKYFSDRY